MALAPICPGTQKSQGAPRTVSPNTEGRVAESVSASSALILRAPERFSALDGSVAKLVCNESGAVTSVGGARIALNGSLAPEVCLGVAWRRNRKCPLAEVSRGIFCTWDTSCFSVTIGSVRGPGGRLLACTSCALFPPPFPSSPFFPSPFTFWEPRLSVRVWERDSPGQPPLGARACS